MGHSISRRDFLRNALAEGVAAGVVLPASAKPAIQTTRRILGGKDRAMPAEELPGEMSIAELTTLVGRADIRLEHPVPRPEAGMPIGNGRTGTLVWTSPTALHMQVNRCDVFGAGANTLSFPERDTDYAGGCAFVDLDLGAAGEDVFTETGTRQHLALFPGELTLQGTGLNARALVWPHADVIAIECNDQRKDPQPIAVELRMLRYARQYLPGRNYKLAQEQTVEVQTRNQFAASQISVRENAAVLVQRFREGKFYSTSAVAACIMGRPAQTRLLGDYGVRTAAKAQQGKFVVLLASAASQDANQDVAELALQQLRAARQRGWARLQDDNRQWWADFWRKDWISLHSNDGVADEIERNYTYFLYVMATCSRGAYMPRFGGLLYMTDGDLRQWGSQFWWSNQACYYDGLLQANRPELMQPLYNTYTEMAPSLRRAAEQQWGSKGIWIPETTWFDGEEDLPQEIASEMRDLYLVRKRWEERSRGFDEFAWPKQSGNSRWNYKARGEYVGGRYTWKTKGAGPFGHTSHIFSSSAKIAWQYWLRYAYSGDLDWLREHAYPMLAGVAEFYRNFPNLRRGDDGRYHIEHVNCSEPVWDARDTQEELCAMHGILPLAIRASELLEADADLRDSWRELLEHLAPIVTSDQLSATAALSPRYWIAGLPPARRGDLKRPWILPALYYDLCTANTEDDATRALAEATYHRIFSQGIGPETPVSVMSSYATVAAHLGRAEDLRYMLINQIRCIAPQHDFCDFVGSSGGENPVMDNRLTLREGPGDLCAERLGRMAGGLHLALLQSAPGRPGEEPVINVFPAWPKDWQARYRLLAQGGVVVTAAQNDGRVTSVILQALVAQKVRVKNPWPHSSVTISRSEGRSTVMQGEVLEIELAKMETLALKAT